MKHILVIFLTIALFSSSSYGGGIWFPGKDVDGTDYTLTLYKNHITIYGADGTASKSILPLQYSCDGKSFVPCGQGTGVCFTITGSSVDTVEIAIRNSWLAALLKASTTGVPVSVSWADNDEDGLLYGTGNLGRGNITEIGHLK